MRSTHGWKIFRSHGLCTIFKIGGNLNGRFGHRAAHHRSVPKPRQRDFRRGVAGVYNRSTYEEPKRHAFNAWAAELMRIVGEKMQADRPSFR